MSEALSALEIYFVPCPRGKRLGWNHDPPVPLLRSAGVRARRALDKHGPLYRGKIRAEGLDSRVASCLGSLLGRSLRQDLPLSTIESVLIGKGVGGNLDEALAQLGFPALSPVERAVLDREEQLLGNPKPLATPAPRRKHARLDRGTYRRQLLVSAVTSWPEPWVNEWVDRVAASEIRLDNASQVAKCAGDARRVSDLLDSNEGIMASKADVAARLFGDAHALDSGMLYRFVYFALQSRLGQYHLSKSELWEKAGIKGNYLCDPALTWGIPVTDRTPMGELIRSANQSNLPLYVTQYALTRGSLEVPPGTKVLAVENPRLVEAAAERNLPICLISANGTPGSAFKSLISQLLRSGAEVRFHTDFDTGGFYIGKSLHSKGCKPWRMTHRDYIEIIEWAKKEGIALPLQVDPRPCPPLPWDPMFRSVYQTYRKVVHQELILNDILDGFARYANGH